MENKQHTNGDVTVINEKHNNLAHNDRIKISVFYLQMVNTYSMLTAYFMVDETIAPINRFCNIYSSRNPPPTTAA